MAYTRIRNIKSVPFMLSYLDDRTNKYHTPDNKVVACNVPSKKELFKALGKQLEGNNHISHLAKELEVAIPTDLKTTKEQIDYANAYMREFKNKLGLDNDRFVYTIAIHNKDSKETNYHFHCLFIDRYLLSENEKHATKERKRYYKPNPNFNKVKGSSEFIRCKKNDEGAILMSFGGSQKTFGSEIDLRSTLEKIYPNKDFSKCKSVSFDNVFFKKWLYSFHREFNKTHYKAITERYECKNITEYSYLKVGKPIHISKGKDAPFKVIAKQKYQVFRKRYNLFLKEYNKNLHELNDNLKKGVYSYQDEDRFKGMYKREFIRNVMIDRDGMNKYLKELKERKYYNQEFKAFVFDINKHLKSEYKRTKIKKVQKTIVKEPTPFIKG